METLRNLDPLTQKEFKLRSILIEIIRIQEERKNGPWEYAAAEKRYLTERRIRRLRRILSQLESLAPWTVHGWTGSGGTTPLSVRQQFIDMHYHYVEDPFLPYPSTDSSSSNED